MNQPAKLPIVSSHQLLKGVFTALATGSLLTPFFTPPAKAEMTDSPKVVIDEVWQIINNDFVDGNFNQVNWLKQREELLSRDYSSKKEAYNAIKKVIKDLGDPYTRFLVPEQFEVLTSETSGEVSGVGVRLAVDPRTQDLYIVDVVKNSPAAQAGLKTGDRIVKIEGKPTALMEIEQAAELFKGELGTELNLLISRPREQTFSVTVTREHIEIPSVSYTLKDEDNLKIGYIKLDEFSSHSAEQMKTAINDLQRKKVTGFVLDLRGNPGGLLFTSVDIARMWLSQGEIVDIVDRQGGHRSFSADGSAITDLPLVVLVDGNSASASEILAGAIKENQRGTVVGTTTYGKGTVQSVHSLSDGSGLTVTISRYYPPSGIDINKKGIRPDIVQDISGKDMEVLRQDPSLIGSLVDPQYRKAVAILKSVHLSNQSSGQNPVSLNNRYGD